MRSPRANVRPACGRRCTPGSWTPGSGAAPEHTQLRNSVLDAHDDRCRRVDCPAQSSATSRPRTPPASSRRSRFRCSTDHRGDVTGPDATQPRVTVRPKPPVLLGATSTMFPLASRRGRVGQPPPEAGPGDSREATVTHHGPSQNGSSCPLRLRPPRGVRSRPSIPPCSVLSASLRFALRPPLWASLACVFRRSLEVRRALVSELNTGCTARHARSMGIREIQTFSPPFSRSSPSAAAAIPSSSPW